MSGYSAGSYAAVAWAAEAKKRRAEIRRDRLEIAHYSYRAPAIASLGATLRDSRRLTARSVTVLADGGVGVVTEGMFTEAMRVWGASDFITSVVGYDMVIGIAMTS